MTTTSRKEAQLYGIDQVELTLTREGAIEEEYIMAKNGLPPNDDEEEDEDKGGETSNDKTPPADDDKEKDDEKKPTFNFQKADPQTLAVLGAVGKALIGLSESGQEAVGADTMNFAKSAIAAAKKASADSDDKLAFAKSILGEDGVAAIQAPVQAEVAKLQKQVGQMQEDTELSEMKKTASEFVDGDDDEATTAKAKQLLNIKKSMTSDEFQSFVEEQRGLRTQVAKSAAFARTSSNQPQTVANSAEAKIDVLVTEFIAKSKEPVDHSTAILAVAAANPTLWGEYQNEVRYRSRQGATA